MTMNGIFIRKAHKKEASKIAELFMLAWPVEDIMESNGISYAQLHDSMTDIAAMEETVYSYENTYVAEVDGKVVGAMCGYDGADYQRFKQPIVDLLGKNSVHISKRRSRENFTWIQICRRQGFLRTQDETHGKEYSASRLIQLTLQMILPYFSRRSREDFKSDVNQWQNSAGMLSLAIRPV